MDDNYDCGYDYNHDHRRLPPLRRPQRNAEAPWSVEETKELLWIRAELDRSFSEIKHNRLLWISIAGRMKARGFNRSDEQCKCKWKNLVTRYKGCETMDPKAPKQAFTFYNDLHAIFTARMQKNWWIEVEDRSRGSKRKATEQFSSKYPNDNGGREGEDEDKASSSTRTAKKMIKNGGKWRREEDEDRSSNLKEILKGFVEREMEMERQWREAFRVRDEERRLKKMEWRMNMEALERERMMMEMMWREKEEERREREEARAEKRDALISALFNRLMR